MRRIAWRPLLLSGCVLLSVLAALLLFAAQRGGERETRKRFQDRAEIAARFIAYYAVDLTNQERGIAERELTAPTVSRQDFRRVTDLLGFEAAVLLDSRGRVLLVAPENPAVIGKDLTPKYAHLRRAVAGGSAVSTVVPSAATGLPIVAFATPYGPAAARRVFSGAFDVTSSPIGSYLHNVTTLAGARVYLVDPEGAIVASNRSDLPKSTDLAAADPNLARALGRTGSSGQTVEHREFAARTVAKTPWRLVVSVPHATLFEALGGFGRYVPWLLWAGFALLGFVSAWLVSDLISSRSDLRRANDDLDRLARIDSLTGIDNRRQIAERLDAAVANAIRHHQELAILMIDVDRFKAFNDDHGHNAGDNVLRAVAKSLHDALRLGDSIGRWGGEEFLIILPSTASDGASVAAERFRKAVAAVPVDIGGELVHVQVSVGAAGHEGEAPAVLVDRADEAMYDAKRAGRDAVSVARPLRTTVPV